MRRKLSSALTSALLLSVLAAVCGTSSASATPKGEFAVFATCPTSTVFTCLYAKTESGKFIIGKETVPIEKAITLQGGLKVNVETGEASLVAATDGNTLSKTPQKVPGGLAGLVKCNEISNFIERVACEAVFENGVTGVTATSELAAPASSVHLNLTNYLTQSGIALSLPLKVHLENPFLGSSCYVGSNAHPIVVGLTTGTTAPPLPNKPISGSPGTEELKSGGEILAFSHNSLVDNSFAAPGATGCGGPLFEFLIDPIVNSKLGLPSAAGHNTAVLAGIQELTSAEAVKAHE